MGTVISRKDFSVEVNGVGPFDEEVIRPVSITGGIILLQSLIRCSVEDRPVRSV